MKDVYRASMLLIPILVFGVWYLTMDTKQEISTENYEDLKIGTFGGGCFWCMEAAFEEADGVAESVSGYTGGETKNPTYEQVSRGETGHYEAVQVYYDPEKITYSQLLEIFWRNINPTDQGGQFADRGSQYKTAIFYHDEEQKTLAERSKKELDESGKFSDPVVTEILPVKDFYEAEEYHQDYYRKKVLQYKTYKKLSGREDFINENWKETD